MTAVTCVENLVPCCCVVLPRLGVEVFVHLHRRDHHDAKGAHHLQVKGGGEGVGAKKIRPLSPKLNVPDAIHASQEVLLAPS